MCLEHACSLLVLLRILHVRYLEYFKKTWKILIRRKKDVNIGKFRTVCKSYLSNKKSGWDKNSALAVDEPAENFYDLRRIKSV